MEKIIELKPLCEIGRGTAKITPSSVKIDVFGIIGSMKAWLVGKEEAEKIGNLVEGKLSKNIDTSQHSGILITQNGRQILMGTYAENIKPEIDVSPLPLDGGAYSWKKITGKSYAGLCEELRYILSNRNVYQNYKRFGHYWAGENETCGALALRCEKEEENPFSAFSDMCEYKNGYVIVCVDKNTKKFRKI